MKKIFSIFDNIQLEEKYTQALKNSTQEGLWDDPKKAEGILKELKYWERLKNNWQEIQLKKEYLQELAGLIDEENTAEIEDFQKELDSLRSIHQKSHIELLLSDQYDQNDAILVISAGTGGVDAQDWAEMLMRMYLRYFEKVGFKAEIKQKSDATEAGIKSVTIEIKGVLAYGYLKSEHGTHRLVRLSPFNAKNLRQTSFALVEVLPILKDDVELQIEEKDLRIDTYRSSGAGGQHVNTTDSAVRITHLPTSTVVTCQSERSQLQNRAQAMQELKSRLLQRMMQEKKEKVDELKGGYKEAAWGNQIRSYVFQPYQMVKDHRTSAETSQVEKVMNGDIEFFIEAYLLNQ